MERREVDRLQVGQRSAHHRQLRVTVHGCPSVPGNVLDHRQHAAVEEPLANRIAEHRRQIGGGPGGTIADDRVGVRLRHVQHRGAID